MAAFAIGKAFEIPKGQPILLVKDGANMVAFAAGDDTDPNDGSGTPAPIGSLYFASDGQQWVKAGTGDTDWTISGLGSPVVTQSADFGKNGNAPTGTFLDRAGGVPSNLSGVPVLLSAGVIKSVAASSENEDTFSIGIYEHQGDFTDPQLLHTITVTASRFERDEDLDIDVTAFRQLAAKVTTGSSSNCGCTVGIKGLSL